VKLLSAVTITIRIAANSVIEAVDIAYIRVLISAPAGYWTGMAIIGGKGKFSFYNDQIMSSDEIRKLEFSSERTFRSLSRRTSMPKHSAKIFQIRQTLQPGTAMANAIILGAALALVNVLMLCSRRPVGRGNRLMRQINGLAQSV